MAWVFNRGLHMVIEEKITRIGKKITSIKDRLLSLEDRIAKLEKQNDQKNR